MISMFVDFSRAVQTLSSFPVSRYPLTFSKKWPAVVGSSTSMMMNCSMSSWIMMALNWVQSQILMKVSIFNAH